ncbi:MAG: hypothetical protein FJ150_09025 [Euryarchaeota archaeon]|nr:hypothetical protein [Euryarchaeota archaeon]
MLFSKITSLSVIVIGILILIGWAFNITILKTPNIVFPTVKSNVGIAFILIGISLWFLQKEKKSQLEYFIVKICALIVVVLGFLTITEYIFNINLGIDQILFKEPWGAVDTVSPNRMAFTASLNVFLIGISLIFLERGRKEADKFSQIFAIIVCFISLLAFLGYIYGVSTLYKIPNYTGMTFYSTVTFLLVSIGILCSRPYHGPMAEITNNNFGGYMARRLLPPVILIPIIFGWLRTFGERAGLYGVGFGVSITILSTVLLFAVIIWLNARSFNNIDIKRKAAEHEVRNYRNNLEEMVEKQTEELIKTNKKLEDEINERKEAEKRLKILLDEKELLVKEIHHRVKNNLMVISSLLNLQSRYIKDKEALGIFKESQSRAKSMALIHERLYQSTDLKRIDFGDYIRILATDLFHTYVTDPGIIKLNINVEDVMVDINTAIPLGLILNELLSNSMKHAFPEGRSGEISIDFHSHDDEFTLIVKDNGVGFPDDLDFKNTDSLGLRLVNSLTQQINGKIEMDRTDGTKFKVTFTEMEMK